MYVPRNVLDTGAAEGAAMEYYKSYNASVLAELERANDNLPQWVEASVGQLRGCNFCRNCAPT